MFDIRSAVLSLGCMGIAITLHLACSSTDDATVDDPDITGEQPAEMAGEQADDRGREVPEDSDFQAVNTAFVEMMLVVDEFQNTLCACEHEQYGFGSADECVDSFTQERSTYEEFGRCIEQGVRPSGTPPEDAGRLMGCMSDNAAAGMECIESIRAEYDEMCSQEAMDELRACDEFVEERSRDCEIGIGEKTQAWMMNVVLEAGEECYEPVEPLEAFPPRESAIDSQ